MAEASRTQLTWSNNALIEGEHFRRALAIQQRLTAESPCSLEHQHRLATIWFCLGNWQLADGRWREARESLSEARAIQESMVVAEPGSKRTRRALAETCATRGEGYLLHATRSGLSEERLNAALNCLERATSLLEPTPSLAAEGSSWHLLLGKALADLGRTQKYLGQAEAAAKTYERSRVL